MTQETLEQIVEQLSNLTVLELAKLKDLLKDAWGVEAAPAAGMMMPSQAMAGGEAAEEKEESTEFDVVLESIDASKKIPVIKEVRAATGLGLKEAKEIVENCPKKIKEAASKSQAEEIKKKLEEAGAKVKLEGL